MSRYIDADALKEFITTHDYLLSDKFNSHDKGMFTIGIFQAINEQPTADVVEVVRCKDCVYWEQATPDSGNCNRALEITAYATDYCSFGERRENGI